MARKAKTRKSRSRLQAREQKIEKLYSRPISSTRSGALFNAFPYPTKISPEAIAIFIATHTSPGACVLDAFGGSGSTGLAALLCDRPTDTMMQMAAELRLAPVWGPRRAVIYEIGTLGAFIAKTMTSGVHPETFEAAAKRILDQAELEQRNLYTAIDPNGNEGDIRYIIWSDVLACPHCRKESTYWASAVSLKPLRMLDEFRCPHCLTKSPLGFAKRVVEKSFDPLLKKSITRKKRSPVLVYGETNRKTWRRPATADDIRRFARIEQEGDLSRAPVEPIAWGDLYRSGYHTGITHLHHFYTYRNFVAINAVWHAIDNEPRGIQDALRLLVLSYNATHSTLMTRVVVKQGQKNFVLTGAQSGVLYVSSLPVEKNVFRGLRRKISTLRNAFALTHGSRSTVSVRNSSSTRLQLQDKTVDYVFTDPPFGDFIPYAEINQINEIWLGKTTDRREEIIVSHSQGKSAERYGELMKGVLSEIARTLKKKGKLTLVFHSSKADIWQALTEAYESAGFGVRATSILDKLQESFKQVVSTGSVKGDPVLLLEKRTSVTRKKGEAARRNAILNDILRQSEDYMPDPKERTSQRMYSRFVTRCLEQGLQVDVDAKEFYRSLISRKHVSVRK